MKSIIDLFENSVSHYPQKTAFIDEDKSVNYSRLMQDAKRIASGICKRKKTNRPIAVYIDKSIECIAAMLGVLYSGNFYVIIDTEMPCDRIYSICRTLNPMMAITNHNRDRFPVDICDCAEYAELVETEICDERLSKIKSQMIDTDPAYALFTSGSTGVPKGAVVSHRSVLTYTQWVTDTFDINEKTVFGNQTPLYFSMSVTDLYSTIQNGATMLLIPKACFSFPASLMKFLKEHRVNTIYWVPSALGIVANWKALDYIRLDNIQKVLFAGEVMPVKYLNYWREHYPDALFANLFGPTEVTDICTYYIVNREFSNSDSLPIGKPCDNCGVFVINEHGKEATNGEEGELYVRGSFLAHGYYNNPQKTQEAFVQNPLNTVYPELVYRTGDVVKYNQFGELEYIGRKDFQIKHMGYRIELGEIETASYSMDGVTSACCIYNEIADEIVLVYEGEAVAKASFLDVLKLKLPTYMHPSRIIKIAAMPHNANGKIDRAWIKENYSKLSTDKR